MTPLAAISIKGVTKTYGGVRALVDVDMSVAPGTIHGLIGCNGAGKSTLVGVLSGTVVPERGRVAVNDKELAFGAPDRRDALGVATVFQHSSLVPGMSIAENMTLGATPRGQAGFVDKQEEARRAVNAMRLVDLELDPATAVEHLSLGDRRLLEIARALAADARCILLDEPTSALTRPEAERLFEHIRRGRDRGVAFIYVSHFLAEVLEISDEVTVLRDGRAIATVDPTETTMPDVVRLMLGGRAHEPRGANGRSHGDRVLSVRGLAVDDALVGVTFAVRAGEVLGLTGLKGSGVDELARALGGMIQHTGAVEFNGAAVTLRSPNAALRTGIAYLPADRLREGMLVEASVRENAALTIYERFTGRLGLLSEARIARAAATELDRFGVVRQDDNVPIGQLSGGNQQKVVLARLTQAAPKVLVLHGPTIGIDVGAKRQIAERIDELAAAGCAIVVASDDMDELCELCDRVLVLVDGRVADEFVDDLDPERLLVACQRGPGQVAA